MSLEQLEFEAEDRPLNFSNLKQPLAKSCFRPLHNGLLQAVVLSEEHGLSDQARQQYLTGILSGAVTQRSALQKMAWPEEARQYLICEQLPR